MQAFLKRLEQLVKMRNQESNRLESETNGKIIAAVNNVIETIDKEIKDAEDEMKLIIESDEDLAKQAKLLRSINGVGDRT
ncbi:MAG: hypothetical protein GY821_13175, partial [Gammaproteobacteria bacterium]|nr:hypothetical protein [Gammaproteobacteria bacterium]